MTRLTDEELAELERSAWAASAISSRWEIDPSHAIALVAEVRAGRASGERELREAAQELLNEWYGPAAAVADKHFDRLRAALAGDPHGEAELDTSRVIAALYAACPFVPGDGCRRCRVCDAAEQVARLDPAGSPGTATPGCPECHRAAGHTFECSRNTAPPSMRSERRSPEHRHRRSTSCRCSITGLEPNEKCPIHGSDWPPRCADCGQIMKAAPGTGSDDEEADDE